MRAVSSITASAPSAPSASITSRSAAKHALPAPPRRWWTAFCASPSSALCAAESVSSTASTV
eukprot:2274080-Pleurochrysis_carterae.AAC.1